MSDTTLYTVWGICLAIAVVIALVAAALLLLIGKAARDIRGNALRCLAAVEQIRQHTDPIWALADTNRVAAGLLDAAQAIEAHTHTAADVLEGAPAGAAG